jgi:signal peptidase
MSERRAARAQAEKEHGLLYYIGVGLSWGLLAFVALVAALVIVVPAVTGSTPYTILTSSMEPGLPPGTLVVVKPINPDDIVIGTVVTYQLESGEPTVVTHRVVAIQGETVAGGDRQFITKGDANSAADEKPVKEVQIRGAVWYSVPWIGWINNLVNGDMRAVIIPIIAVGLFVYAGWMIVSSRLEKRRKQREAREADADASAEQPAPFA